MDHDFKKLHSLGCVTTLPNGENGVNVTLQCTKQFKGYSRQQRKEKLLKYFQTVVMELSSNCLVDLDSISVSGQTIEGVIAVKHFDELNQKLSNKNIRVDLVIDRQIV